MSNGKSGKAAFFDLLQQRKEETGGPALERRRAEWVRDVDRLIKDIQRWLLTPMNRRLLKVKREEIFIEEEGLRRYKVPMLTIDIPGSWSVEVVPIGMRVVAAIGRVDLVVAAAGRRMMIARFEPGSWKLLRLTDQGKIESEPLLEDTFFAALKELVE